MLVLVGNWFVMERNFQGKKGSFAHRNFHHLSFLITFFGNIFANSRLWFFQTQCCKLIQKASKIIMPRSQGKFQGPPFPYYSASSHTKSLVAMGVLWGSVDMGMGVPPIWEGIPGDIPGKQGQHAQTQRLRPCWCCHLGSCHAINLMARVYISLASSCISPVFVSSLF